MGIVEDAQFAENRQQADQVFAASIPALTDFAFGDGMSAATSPSGDAGNVKLDALKTCEPNLNPASCSFGLLEKTGNRVAAKRSGVIRVAPFMSHGAKGLTSFP